MTTTLVTQSPRNINSEQRIILSDITWEQYEIICHTLEDNPGAKLAYFEGILEIMTPSPEHEEKKATLGKLLDIYSLKKGIKVYRRGSPTLKNKPNQRGKEPDESFNIGTKKEIPDIAIEIIISSGSLDILSLYQGIGVPEVWIWQERKLSVYELQNQNYKLIKRSQFFPELDLELLKKYLNYEDQHDAVTDFIQAITSS